MKKFDLNIEKILESWEIHHAVRELLANAIDEQVMTNSQSIEVFKENETWIIRDYGRGIKYSSLTQNENEEKIKNPHVIGKFGIGLKDALATLDRHDVQIEILSKYNRIKTLKSPKEGFNEIVTLHALIDENIQRDFVGTKIELKGISDEDVEKAKRLFLMFSKNEILSRTKYGDVIHRGKENAFIYINGVRVAEEDNFLFSYNITNVSSQIKKALNRERTNVGRSAYADSIKKILLSSKDEKVAEMLAKEMAIIESGEAKDELSWIDIQEHAIKILSSTNKYVFITGDEAMTNTSMIDEIKNSGRTPIVIPLNLREKIKGGTDIGGNPIQDINQFLFDYNDSFAFEFIDNKDLSDKERDTYSFTDKIINLFGGLPKQVKKIVISKTMRKDFVSNNETLGCWDAQTSAIVVHRSQLGKLPDYCGTLIHELIHAKTGLDDVDREFETELTKQIGKFLSLYLEN